MPVIPADISLVGNDPKHTALVVADGGRTTVAEPIRKLLDKGYRVVAVDPFYIGESRIVSLDFLFVLVILAIGERLQDSQILARAGGIGSTTSDPVLVVALGERMSLAALIAAAIDRSDDPAISNVHLHGSLGSLKQIIERNNAVNTHPELFCFGLLAEFDIKQLVGMVAPREVRLLEPSDRARSELTDLKKWYGKLDRKFDPLQ